MRGLIYIEDSELNISAFKELRRYLLLKTNPLDFIITQSESSFRKYLLSTTYTHILVALVSKPVVNFCQELLSSEDVSFSKAYMFYFLGSKTIIGGWAGENKLSFFSKSFKNEELARSLDNIVSPFLEEDLNSIMLKVVGNGFQKIILSDIIFLQGAGCYTNIYLTVNQVLKVQMSQDKLISLKPTRFLKVHRSYVVNKRHIINLQNGIVYLRNGYNLPVTKSEKAILELL